MSFTLYIMVGPPCSGKSTWAKRKATCNHNTVRVNRDEIRQMLKGSYVFGHRLTEKIATEIETLVVRRALLDDHHVIVDATHCTPKSVNKIKAMIPSGVNVDIEYRVFDIPYWKQRWRNFWRYIKTGIWIPVDVSKNMHKTFQVTKRMIENNEI